jgi:Ca2+-binding RTX toxin-like protein
VPRPASPATLDNLLYAGAGDNILSGDAGSDTVSYYYGVSGTTGVTVSLATAAAQATGGSGTDTLKGIEHLRGSNHADQLTGNADANRLEGYAGNDTLDGGAGNDSMIGGDGSDMYYLRDAGDTITETNATASTGGTDIVQSYLTDLHPRRQRRERTDRHHGPGQPHRQPPQQLPVRGCRRQHPHR